MKKLCYIFFLIGTTITAQTNLSTYGAVGNGVTDDTAALQAAFNAGTDLVSDSGKTYLISGTLYLNKNLIQTIDFNGSTITRNSTVHFMIDIDKRGYANSLTTLKNLVLDGNDKGGSGIDISSRVHLQNVEIKDIIHNNANGIRSLIYNLPGCYGQWVFDNVDIHDLEPVGNDGNYGNDLGAAHGWIASVQQIPSQTTQIVYKNSSLHSIWGEDAGAITVFSAGLDISYSNVSFWFENVSVADAQRRAVKGFTGNQTWINSTFTSATYDNPNIIRTMPSAGLFVIGPGSSSTGGENNVICGCTFQGHPSDPFDSWYTRVIMTGDLGPSGLKISNSTFTGANPQSHPDNGFTAFGPNLQYLSIDNSTFGTQNGVRLVGNFADYAYMSTNNTYVDGKATTFARTTVPYTEPTIPYTPCPTIGGIITDPDPPTGILSGLKFSETGDRIIYFDEGTTNPAATLSPTTTETGQTHTYEIVPRAGNDDSSKFRIVSGQLVLNNGSSFTPDFENPLDYNTNNIYACNVKVTASPSGSTYTEDMVFYISNVEDEVSEVAVTSIAFSGGDQTVNIGIPVDLSVVFNGGATTPTNTTKYYISANTDILTDAGVPINSGVTTIRAVADDTSNGTIEHEITININGGNGIGAKRFFRVKN